MLIIRRYSGWGDRLRAYKVMLDGKEVGQIADGGVFKHEISKGNHSLYLKIDYARSKQLHFTSGSDKDVEFICCPNVTGFKILLFFFYLTVLSSRYIKLERVV